MPVNDLPDPVRATGERALRELREIAAGTRVFRVDPPPGTTWVQSLVDLYDYERGRVDEALSVLDALSKGRFDPECDCCREAMHLMQEAGS